LATNFIDNLSYFLYRINFKWVNAFHWNSEKKICQLFESIDWERSTLSN
jgi:hypothetical protein